MKKALIIYNTLFLILGNVLFSNLHHLDHDHSHDHDFNHTDCEECIIIDNTNNYTLNCDEVLFSNKNYNQFVYEFIGVIKRSTNKRFLSRAPPIS